MAPYGGFTQAGKSKDQELPTVIKEGPYTRCRIVAVCGVNDHEDNASPTMDGWLISDFYMLHHLLKPVSEFQTWLTCLEPELLIKKYGPFIQGNPCIDDRRVVLDNDMPPNLANITCVDERHLLQELISAIEGESAKAVENSQTLIMIFIGHGEAETFRIVIGGCGNQAIARRRDTNRLEQSVVARHLHPKARATLITTSCYSGSWVVSPLFNASMLAGTTLDEESVSWPQATQGRCCGSPFATSVIQALIMLNIPGLFIGDGHDKLNPQSFTYVALTKAVHDSYVEREGAPQTDPAQPIPTFLSRNNNWGEDFSWTGLQAIDYWARWNTLKKVPKSEGHIGVAVSGSVSTIGSRRLLMPKAAKRVLQQLATQYLDSFPGLVNEASNINTDTYCQQILDPTFNPSAGSVQKTGQTLHYRLYDIMERATIYKKAFHVDFPNCEQWDAESFRCNWAKDAKLTNEYKAIEKLVVSLKLFDQPMGEESWYYKKGDRYLAAVVFNQKWNYGEAVGRLTRVKYDWKEKTGKVERAVRELCLRDSVCATIKTIGKETGKRVIIPN